MRFGYAVKLAIANCVHFELNLDQGPADLNRQSSTKWDVGMPFKKLKEAEELLIASIVKMSEARKLTIDLLKVHNTSAGRAIALNQAQHRPKLRVIKGGKQES